jgi:hypothetical protein
VQKCRFTIELSSSIKANISKAILCPLCDSRLNIDYFSEDDPIRAWWDEAIIKADLTGGNGRFSSMTNAASRCPVADVQFYSQVCDFIRLRDLPASNCQC